MILYAATSNSGKLAEFTSTAAAAGISACGEAIPARGEAIEVRALPGLAAMPEPAEDAATFLGNAELKAIAYSVAAPGLLVFADDSGLEAAALGGQPGVRSARYAEDLGFEPGSGSKDGRNNRALLSQLAFHTDRSARFVCAVALARDGQILLRAEGSIAGEILAAPRGEDGFGYDPLFFIPSLGLTLAELKREEKWTISHRGRAFRALIAEMQQSDIARTIR